MKPLLSINDVFDQLETFRVAPAWAAEFLKISLLILIADTIPLILFGTLIDFYLRFLYTMYHSYSIIMSMLFIISIILISESGGNMPQNSNHVLFFLSSYLPLTEKTDMCECVLPLSGTAPRRSTSTRARGRSTQLTTRGGSTQTAPWRRFTLTAGRRHATPPDVSGSKTKTATLSWTTRLRNSD